MLTGEFPPDHGGVGDYTARLASALAARGIPVGVLTDIHAGMPAAWMHVRHAVRVPVRAQIGGWDPACLPHVVRALRCLGSQPILHIQYQAGAFDLGGTIHLVPTIARALRPRCRVVTTFHDFRIPYLFPKAGPLRLAANRLLARSSDAAIFTEQGDRDLARVEGHVIPIGSNIDPVRAERGTLDAARAKIGAHAGDTVIGYFGFLNSSKGLETLLAAVRQLVDRGLPIRLALLGGSAGASDPTDRATSDRLSAALAALGLSDLTYRSGFVEAPALSVLLGACDVMALPFEDGASLRRGSLMAALAHGLPIVTTQPADASSTLVHARNALLVPAGDSVALGTALERLIGEPSTRAALSQGALELAREFDWDTIAARTANVYAQVLA
ncbi:MAG: glycosyltransferase [Chloroflexota bacterium]